MLVRLQKALADAGIGSRRTCETWIKDGRVRIDGQVVTEMGTKVDLATQRLTFDGRVVKAPLRHYYIALNKPRNVVCSLADSHAARLVTDLVDIQGKPMLRPVGRLDADSEGLIFLSDDGDFIHKMTHPRHQVGKTYRATVQGIPDAEDVRALMTGIWLEDGLTAPAERIAVYQVKAEDSDLEYADVTLTIHEGRNRQVRRMFAALGHRVVRLVRIAIGPVRLTALPSGAWRHLSEKEITLLTAERDEPKNPKENPPSWQIELQPSRRPRASSSPNSSKATPPRPPRTSSNSPKKGFTTD